jgi:type VI secretion system protein ImpL
MRWFARLIFNRWALTVVGLVAISLLVWWVGPTISISNFYPYEAEWVRWIQIAVIVLVPVGRAVARAVKARRANAALATGLLQAPAAGVQTRPDASVEELAQLRQRFEQALGLLRKLRFGAEKPSLWARLRSLGSQQYLYGLPWYVFIGAPGPENHRADQFRAALSARGPAGREAVRGVGGPQLRLVVHGRGPVPGHRRAVHDPAERPGCRRCGLERFLQLLKKSRPRCPINGVLVTVSVGDLLQQSSAEADLHAQALRARVQELYTELGVSIPIYVLVTKSDLLAGFTEFFATLGKDERAQAWGFSRSHLDQGLDAASLSTELERLERRLYERLPDRLEEERDPARRALLYSFPQQFALVRGRLVHLIEATFAPNTFQATPRLRGVYFTSGTQEGSPIDRVMGTFARDLGLERKLLPAQYPSGRSYFLTRLLREVVFPEAGLAGLDLRGERRRQWLQAGAFGVAGAALILATLAWWISYSHNREYLAEVATQVKEAKQQIPPSGAKNDASEILPTLTIVRSLSETRATADGSVPWTWRFGLYQGGKIETASRAVYQRMLQDTLLPSLTTYLERYLVQGSSGGLDDSYDALKTYTMLYDPKRFNREAVWRWYQTHGDQLLPGADRDAQKALRAHFEALYERGWVDPAVPRNDELLRQRRADIGRDSLPKRIYDRLKGTGPRTARLHHRGEGRAPCDAGLRAREPRATHQGRARPLHQGRLLQALRKESRPDCPPVCR